MNNPLDSIPPFLDQRHKLDPYRDELGDVNWAAYDARQRARAKQRAAIKHPRKIAAIGHQVPEGYREFELSLRAEIPRLGSGGRRVLVKSIGRKWVYARLAAKPKMNHVKIPRSVWDDTPKQEILP